MPLHPGVGVIYLRPRPSRIQRFPLTIPAGARVLVPFWNARVPAGSSVELGFELGTGPERETFSAALWGPRPFRGSFKKKPTPLCRWDSDTLTLNKKPRRVTLTVRLRGKAGLTLLGVAWRSLRIPASPPPAPRPVPLERADFPLYSQRRGPRAIAGRICSPTSMSMALGGLTRKTVRYGSWAWEAYDPGADIFGNWSFNTAAAAESLARWGRPLACHPAFLESLGAGQAFLDRGLPLILSLRFEKGGLPGAPLSRSSGHLVLLRGFDGKGQALVHDPAAKTARGVARVYGARELDRAWRKSGRLAYVFTPLSPPKRG